GYRPRSGTPAPRGGADMATQTQRPLTFALLAALALARPAPAQSLPPAPIPVPSPSDNAGPPIGLGRPVPVPSPPPPQFVVPPPAPPPGPILADPYAMPLGCESVFFTWQLEFLVPTVKNQLTGSVTLANNVTYPVAVPRSELDWVLAPSFILGYRL